MSKRQQLFCQNSFIDPSIQDFQARFLKRRLITMNDEKNSQSQGEEREALIVVDVQKDFLPGGKLAVPGGDQIIPQVNRLVRSFLKRRLPIFFTRDWHPPNHISFEAKGGPWTPHCVAGSPGAEFAAELYVPKEARIVSKAKERDYEAYSGFQGTDLAKQLKDLKIRKVNIAGLATDYCVLNTVRDAIQSGFQVRLVGDAVRGINVKPGDEERAIEEMKREGAKVLSTDALISPETPEGEDRTERESERKKAG